LAELFVESTPMAKLTRLVVALVIEMVLLHVIRRVVVIVRLGDSHCVGLSDSHDFMIRLVERLIDSCLHRSPGTSTTEAAEANRNCKYNKNTCYDLAYDRSVPVAVARTNNNWAHIGGANNNWAHIGVVGIIGRLWVVDWLCVSVRGCICISVGLGRTLS